LSHAQLVQYPLATGAVPVDVAAVGLLDGVVGEVGVQEGFGGALEAEFGVGDFSAGFEEGGHSHADDVDFRGHGCGMYYMCMYVCCVVES